MRHMHLAAALVALGSCASAAMAQDSVYTYTDERGFCFDIDTGSEDPRAGLVQSCDGMPGWIWFARVSEHGHSSRFSDRDDPQVPGQYGGYLGNFGQYHTVIEWRVGRDDEPYATIHRYISATFESGDAERQETLIVTALRPGETPSSCHVGYVDASAVAGANAIAREMADRLAPSFDCQSETIWAVDAAAPTLELALETASVRRAN